MQPAVARRIWWLVWLALAVVLAGRAASRKPSRGVLLDHVEFGRRALHGEDLYGPWRSSENAEPGPLHAPYPPSFALLTVPFHLLDAAFGQRAARLGWALLQLASLVALALALRELLAPRAQALAHAGAPPWRWQWLWLGAFLLGARFVLRDTHGGGGNAINTALAVGAFLCAERGRDRTAGALLAFSLVTKPTMVWLLPVAWICGQRRALGWTAAWTAGFVLLAFALCRGDFAPWARWWAGSWSLMTQADPWADPAHGFPRFAWMNTSLRLCVARWCGDVPAEFAARVPGGIADGLGLAAPTVAWLTRAAGAAVLAAVLAAAWRGCAAASGRLWAVAAALVATLLLSPITWKGHHVALLPALLLTLHRAVVGRDRAAATLLAIWFVPCALPGGDLVGDAMDERLNSLYVVTFGDLALLAYAVRRAWSAAREDRDAA
jgi:chromate transport protein ChrA